jgi:hypothetical protein
VSASTLSAPLFNAFMAGKAKAARQEFMSMARELATREARANAVRIARTYNHEFIGWLQSARRGA